MGASVGTLLTMAVLLTGTLMMFRAALFGHETINDAMKESTQLEGERAMTALSITSTEAENVFRCDTKAVVNLDNVGEVPIREFDQMDVLTWYTPETGDPFTKRFTYTPGNLEKDEWNLDILPPGNGSGAWDPGETASLVWRFLQPQKEGTLGYVTVGAPNGVYDSDYLDFTSTISGDCRFLHNNPTPPAGDSASQVVLPMDAALPVAATLYNYDADRDSTPGLTLVKTPLGLSEIDPAKYQVWRTGVLTSPVSISGTVLFDVSAAMKDFAQDTMGIITVYLRDKDGVTYTEIGQGSIYARDWQSGSVTFVERSALVPGFSYTIPAEHELEVWMVVENLSGNSMWIAYDTATEGSNVALSYVPPPVAASYYLHNNPTPPTGDTTAQPVLLLHTTAPTAATLFNYDSDRDADPGLKVDKNQLGLSETDPLKFQVWRTGALGSPLAIKGDVLIDVWAAIKNFDQAKTGVVTAYLRDFDGATYTEIDNGGIYVTNWQDGYTTFVQRTILILDVDYTVPAANELEIRLMVDNVSGSDMWFAYDTTAYPTVIKLP